MRVVVVGGGEHARVLLDAALAMNPLLDVAGFIDPDPAASLPGLDRLGGDEVMGDLDDVALILGVGVAGVGNKRPAVVDRLGVDDDRWLAVVHPAATVGARATIAPGAAVLAGAIVGVDAAVGPFTIVNSGAIVEHDVTLERHAVVGPGARIGGGTTVGALAHIGIGAIVRDHVTIGDHAVVAMGAVVVGDVLPSTQVRGVPATVYGES